MRGDVWYYQEEIHEGAVWYYQEEIHERCCLVLSGGDT